MQHQKISVIALGLEQYSGMNFIAGLITVLIPLLFGTINAITPVSDTMVGRNRDFSYAVNLFSRTGKPHVLVWHYGKYMGRNITRAWLPNMSSLGGSSCAYLEPPEPVFYCRFVSWCLAQ